METYLQQLSQCSAAHCKKRIQQDISPSPHWLCSAKVSASCLWTWSPTAKGRKYYSIIIKLNNVRINLIMSKKCMVFSFAKSYEMLPNPNSEV